MDRPGHEDIKFFTGTEVEHSPAYNKKTLFVVGIQPVKKILMWAKRQKVEHIYFGANQSFPQHDITMDDWQPWIEMITACLDDYVCTLDIDVYQAHQLVQTDLTGYVNFIPMISVKLPHINQLGYNATLKIDDVDFAATNPGVWCHSIHDLQNRSVFTDWSKYSKDSEVS